MSDITRCVCTRLTFAELLRRSAAIGGGFEALRAETGCADRCGLCEPYIRAALRTGRTSFRPLDPAIVECAGQAPAPTG